MMSVASSTTPRDGLELVEHALDANRGDRGALDGTEQGAAQGVADGGAKAALKGLGAELAEVCW